MSIDLRPSQALGLWHAATLEHLRIIGPDLTIRQMAILLHIYLAPPPHTVRGLAARLGVTKPVITRALDTMGAMSLVKRVRDDRDKRNVIIKRTVEGALFVEKLGDIIIAEGRKLPDRDGARA
ncbi:MarR family protein [Hoeflea marina]|uniref:MarR family protein n=1 Tax=Hoeflea marina TaxID=274592 RepID=A0A317PL45_9HYPH|nr:MarR family transcriptional regulator [Hoeflea marina]PWW00395.1 MarR family protein [Hoeflea marina]